MGYRSRSVPDQTGVDPVVERPGRAAWAPKAAPHAHSAYTPLSAGRVKDLQRLVGNSAVANALRGERQKEARMPTAGSPKVVVSRDDEAPQAEEEHKPGVMYATGEYVISESKFRELIGDGSLNELEGAYEWLRLQTSPSLEPIKDHYYWNNQLAKLSTYIRERSAAVAPADLTMSFDGQVLTLGAQSWTAVSGTRDSGAGFDYSVESQRAADKGPIPEGAYWIDPGELVDLRKKWFYSLFYESGWGTHRITLHPYPQTKTYGRGGFFLHGGSTPGSIGCIDLTSQMEDLSKALSNVPKGQVVRLLVAYPRPHLPSNR